MKIMSRLLFVMFWILLAGCSPGSNLPKEAIEAYQPIISYSKLALEQIIGNETPSGVEDFFLLLPDSLCFDKTIAERKSILAGKDESFKVFEQTDRFISLLGPFEGEWEIYRSQNSSIWALNHRGCGPACVTLRAYTYIFRNNHLYQSTQFGFTNKVNTDDLVDKTVLSPAQSDALEQLWIEMDKAVLYDLPRYNDSLTVYLDPLYYLDLEIPYTAFKKLKIRL